MRSFFLIALVIYILASFLVYFKFIRQFKNLNVKLLISIVFIIIAGAFPVAEILYDGAQGGILKLYLLTGYYYLPFLLYCFLLLIVFQMILFSLKVWKLQSGKFTIVRSFQRKAISIFMFISMVIVLAGHINFNNTRITHYQIEVPSKVTALNRLKIVMAADLHIYELTSQKFINQFVDKVNSIRPDIVLLPGDILEGGGETNGVQYFENKIREIQSKYGVYAAPGNHERYGQSFEETDFFRNAGIQMLNDSVIVIDQAFYLVGLSDRGPDSTRIIQLLSQIDADSLPAIILSHRPDDFGFARRAHADIQLSGHTHHGQIWPLNMITSSMYELSWGYEKIDSCHVFVTCGAQGWGPPVRTSGYSEIMEIDVVFSHDESIGIKPFYEGT